MTGSAGLRVLPLGPALVRFTGRDEGDLGPSAPRADAEPRRRAVIDRPWRWARQVHGATVVWASRQHLEADALLTNDADQAVAVFTADCAPVALASVEGTVAAVHAGWRGLEAGVIEAAVAALQRAGASSVLAALGPCIHPCCYEFSDSDLARIAARYGDAVVSTTRAGLPALDLPGAVATALGHAGAELVAAVDACTSCSPGYFSHRARLETQRQAGVVWLA